MNKNKKKYYVFQIDLNTLNIGSFILFIPILIISYLLYPTSFIEVLENYTFLEFFTWYFIYIILHEILHSISYVINGANFNKITYGIVLEKSILCCLCKQNITKKNILHSLMYPLVFIGIITYIISLIFKLPLLFILSIFNIVGCIGDIIMFFFIKKLDNDIEFSEYDDPIGFGIYSNKDISKEKHFGLNFIETTSSLKREDYKKVVISKPSIIFIIIFIIIGILL